MAEPTPGWERALAIATLSRLRGELRSRLGVALVAGFSVGFALLSMLVGLMLEFGPEAGPYTARVINQPSTQWWNYPALLIVQPWGIVTLPFFATIAMVVVSFGVGLGMAIAVVLGLRLVRDRRTAPKGPTASSVAGALTPAMIAALTLGACCSTTAVTLASIGTTAQVTGTTVNNLLLNNWYLPVFQMVVLWIALVAQEQLVRVYGSVLGLGPDPSASVPTSRPPVAGRGLWGIAARALVVVAGVTWGLTLLAEWTVPSPPVASLATGFQVIVLHLVPAVAAVAVGFFPEATGRWLSRASAAGLRVGARAVLLVSGVALLTWVPPSLIRVGVSGFVNQMFGLLGLPVSWGATPTVVPGVAGWGLLLLQYLLLGGLSLGLAVDPAWTMGRLGQARVAPGPGTSAGGPVGSPAGGPPAAPQPPTEGAPFALSSPAGSDRSR